MTSVELDGSPLLKSSVAFTGRLACMSRAEAFDVVRQRGGMPSPAVTKGTQVLIVGELGWPLLDDGRASNKLSRATALGNVNYVVSDQPMTEEGWVAERVTEHGAEARSEGMLIARRSEVMLCNR
jgi:NAD-dependent DNA ligase